MRLMIMFRDRGRRTSLVDYLRAQGHDVLVPPPRQGVRSIITQRAPHVIILDLYGSAPKGESTLRAIRAAGYKGHVIGLANKSAYTEQAECLRLGLDQVVQDAVETDRPFDPAQVDAVIRATVDTTIARRARHLSRRSGRPGGPDREDWVQARRDVIGDS